MWGWKPSPPFSGLAAFRTILVVLVMGPHRCCLYLPRNHFLQWLWTDVTESSLGQLISSGQAPEAGKSKDSICRSDLSRLEDTRTKSCPVVPTPFSCPTLVIWLLLPMMDIQKPSQIFSFYLSCSALILTADFCEIYFFKVYLYAPT